MNNLKTLSIFALFACALAGALSSCKKEEKPDVTAQLVKHEPAKIAQDSVETITEDTIAYVPEKKADELFDDFVFAFMKNQTYQMKRVDFPLKYNVDGQMREVAREDWAFDRMYSQYDLYTLVFDNKKAELAAKDTTLKSVIVEELNLDTHRTRNYDFKRREGEWRLTAINEGGMSESDNSEFYTFYHKFATDAAYQRAHICDPLEYSTFDDDNFETIEGIIAADQFEDFAPQLPTTKITNILYGQSYKNSTTRILSLRALSSGMECTMVFKKNDGEWMLTRLDN